MQSLKAESLSQSVSAALTESPTVLKAVSRASGALEDITTAKARMRPNVLLEAGGGIAWRDRFLPSDVAGQPGSAQGTGDALFSRSASLTIQQLLLDWGATGRLVNSAKMRKMYSDLLVAEAREEQALLVTKTYLDLIGARLKAGVMANKLTYLNEYRTQANDRAASEGEVPVSVIDGKLANARGDREKLLGQIAALEGRYRLLTLRNPTNLSMPPMPRVPGGSVDTNANPGVAAAQYGVNAAKENVEGLRKDLLPTIGLELKAGSGQNVLGVTGPDNELSALAVLRWNPFDGGRKRAAVRKAQAQVQEEQATMDDIKLAINDRVASAQAQMKAAALRHAELSKSIGGLTDAVGKYKDQMKANTPGVTPLSMVSVEVERTSVQLEIVDSEVDRYVGAYTVLASAGQILDFFGIHEGSSAKAPVHP